MADGPLVVSTSPPPPAFFEGVLPGGTRVVKVGQEGLLDMAAEATVIIGDWEHQVRIDRAVIEQAARCRLIQQPSAGYENIDVDAASEAGIPVANAGPANSAAVAEHAIMLALACLRHLPEALTEGERGDWSQADWIDRDLPELGSRSVGILGLGSIGREVALRLRLFGCELLYSKRNRLEPADEAALGARYLDLESLLSQSEILVICLPLTADTRGLLDRARLQRLPQGAVVINIARGDVMDYGALADLLRDGHLGGAGLDVFPVEPPPRGHELAGLPNTLLTPHYAGATQQAKRNILVNSIDNVNAVLRGEEPRFIVNEVRRKASAPSA